MRSPSVSSYRVLTLVLLSSLALAGCKKEEGGQGGAEAAAGHGAMPPAAVEFVTVTAEDVQLEKEYAGRTAGSREVEVRARVGGILLERTYVEGSAVKQGDILFRIDPEPYKLALDRTKAQKEQADARLKAASRNWDRASSLFQKQAVSAKTRDDALSELESSRAAVALAEAETKTAQLNLDYTAVTAPISGITSRETRSEGSLIGAGAADSLLTRITQLDPVYVIFAFPDADFMRQKELLASGVISADADAPLKGTLIFADGTVYDKAGEIDFTAATVDSETGTVQARAVFPNLANTVLPGQFVRIKLHGLTRKGTILVPEAAIMQGPQGKFVYRIDAENKAQIAPVKTKDAISGRWIVEEGLNAGDRIITNGVIKVMPGAPVNPTPAPTAEKAPPAVSVPVMETHAAPEEPAAAPATETPEATGAVPAAEQPATDSDPFAVPAAAPETDSQPQTDAVQ